MKTLIIIPTLICSTLLSVAQSSQTRDIKPFKKIELSGSTTVVYRQSDTLLLRVEANDDDVNNIYTVVENETLVIKAKGNAKSYHKIYVNHNQLNSIECSGVSKITSANTINADSLSIDISGASSVNLNLNSKTVNVLESGASSVTLEGKTQLLYTTISGASVLKAYKLNATTSNISVSGASSAKVFTTDKIKANATGSSTIKFKGNPAEVSAEASTSSTVAKVVDGELSSADKNSKDSTSINFRKKKFIIINKDGEDDEVTKRVDDDDFHHWGGFAMGINGLLSNGNATLPKSQNYMNLNYGKSLNYQLNFEKDIHLYKNYVNLVTGIGFEWNQYEFSNKTKLNPDSSYTFGTIDTTNTFLYKKNKLKTTFVNVPLLVEFNTNKNPNKAFHIAVGVIGGYKLGSRTRQVLEQNNYDIKIIRKDNYNINPFKLNAHASIGYKNFTVFGSYSLTNLFESGKGPALTPFTVGLKIVTF